MVSMISIYSLAAVLLSLALLLTLAPATALAAGAGDVLKLDVTNDSSAVTNKWSYKIFTNKAYTFQSGDYIEYDVKLLSNVTASGGIDIKTTDGKVTLQQFKDRDGTITQNGGTLWLDSSHLGHAPNQITLASTIKDASVFANIGVGGLGVNNLKGDPDVWMNVSR